MRQRDRQSGFSTIAILLIVLVGAVLTVTGLVVYQHHKPSSAKNSAATSQTQTTTQPQSTTTTQPAAATTQYLTVKEWGVKIPLSSTVQDAYYVVPTGISNNADGKPSGIILGITSLNSSCGTVSSSGHGIDNALGEIVRSLPTETDPVSGKLYTQLNPGGITIGGYYYGYVSSSKSKTCSSATTFQSIDSAFDTATKSAATTTAN